MKFSQRLGLTPVANAIQTAGMNEDLRNSLWNILDLSIWSREGFVCGRYGSGSGAIADYSKNLWFHYFKQPIDSRPGHPYDILKRIREYFFRCKWFEAYDFIEFTIAYSKDGRLADDINTILERELAGFRYVGGTFVPVTDDQEVAALKEAVEQGPFKGVAAHLRQALEHLSNKQNPDYRNSIKESISAVESMAREMTKDDKATLGDALAILERSGALHPALKKGLSALYGYTSDENGIRHSMLEEPDLSAADAKFFLVACATFVNYLKSKL